ncbi:hypothetical protein [Indiicoccus explosivorum]|uniref:hypothetical protein n=1 Tax=Indiicoccus explosivorum TaxID=1917864 RepID=UPI000B44F586|nr:hypothetical protein [Indiicoccus explosivorum]
MKKWKNRLISSTAITALLLGGGMAVSAHGGGDHEEGFSKADEVTIKKATARFHSVKQAIRAGYINTQECVSVPGLGGMGIHFVNPGLVDEEADPAYPEALLYEPTANGFKLIGVEYLSADPNEKLFGQQFDPPGAVPEYSLHVWVWEDNPSGTFAPFNPNVSCPVPE